MSGSGDNKYPPRLTLRITFEERAALERAAAGLTLSAYVRSRLFGADVSPRRASGKAPIKDRKALAQLLGELGKSRLSSNLNQLAKAVNMGALPVSREVEADLRDACAAVIDMRHMLFDALGLRQGGRS